MAETLAAPGRRVKVYVLNGAGKWDDRGTGHVRVETDPDTKSVVLKVTSDETGRVSLTSTIRATREALYQMQEDNIISWNEEIPAGVPTEVALSFQETEGCRELWEKICHVDAAFKRVAAQRAASSSSRTQSGMNAQSGSGHQGSATDGTAPDPLTSDANVPSSAAENLHHHASPTDGSPLVDPTTSDTAHSRFFDDNLEGAAWGNADAIDDVVFPDTANVLFLGNSPASFVPTSSGDAGHPSTFVMPEPDRAGIETLARIMSDQAMLSLRAVREEIIAEVLTSDYITKVCQVFRRAERKSDLDCLAMLYHVIRCLFIIGNNGVLEILVNEKHLMDIVGCLEYDQDRLPELERKKAELKRKRSKKKQNSASSSGSPSGRPKSSNSAEQGDQANRQREVHSPSEKQKPSTQTEGKLEIGESPGVTAASEQHTASMETETSKETHEIRDRESASATDKTMQLGDEVGKRTAAVQTTHSELTSSKIASKQDNQSSPEKNNSEETSSSGNFPEGEAPRFSLRTHRDYLERKVSYRSVVPINDQNVVAKIHQNYRVAYIRDVILSRVFDDGMNNMLSGVILCNNVDIIMYFISGSSALQELFARLKATVQNRRRIQEATVSSGKVLCMLSKQNEIEFSKELGEKGAMIAHEVVSTHDSAKSLTEVQSDERKGVIAKSDHKPEPNSSSGLAKSLTSNHISLTTADSCPTTDPNVVTSADQSSQDEHGRKKKRFDSRTGDPKSSEQSEELHEDLRNMLGLLRELCQVVKGQQPAVQARFHQMLLELGALEISVSLLLDKDAALRSLCCDILSTAIYHDQGDVRAHIMKNATQQHSSVPKQQIGSRKSSPSAIPLGGKAIVTEAGASGVTAEVAIGEEQGSTVEKKSLALFEGSDVDMSKANDSMKLPRHDDPLTGREKAKAAAVSHQTCSHAAPESKEASLSARHGKSQDSVSNGSRDVGTASCVTSTPKDSPRSSTSGGANADTHRMAAVSVSKPDKGVSDLQDDSVRLSFTTNGQNQSRVETDFPLLSAMIEVICQDKESGVALTVLDLLRTLLDPMNMKPSLEKSMFLNAFYEKFVFRLMAPIEIAAHPEHRDGTNEQISDENVSHICDLFSYCVSHHAFRSKYFVLGNNVGGKIVELVRHKKAHVRLSGVRFVRTCVGMHDDMYDRYVIEKRLMDPIMEMYSRNQHKDNLTSSSVLDLVSFLSTAKRELLLRYVITEYSATLQPSTKNCIVFEDAKRVLCAIENNKALNPDGKDHSKDTSQGNAVQLRSGETGIAEQRAMLGKNDTDDSTHAGSGVFLSHLDTGEISSQMVMNSTFRDGTVPANMRFGTNFHGQDVRMFGEEDAFFARLAGGSDVVHKSSGTDQNSVEPQAKPRVRAPSLGRAGRSPEQGGIRHLETRGLGTPRGILSKLSPFKTGLRSVSQSTVPKRGHVGVKNILPTGLRSQAITSGDSANTKSPKRYDTKKPSPEKSHATPIKERPGTPKSSDSDVIMADEMSRLHQNENTTPKFHDRTQEQWNGKAIRLSLSKSKAKNGDLEQLRQREDEVVLSESSEDPHSPRKRERVDCENSIETSTKSVLGRRSNGDDSPTKRRRVEDGTDGQDKAKKSKDGLEDSSENLECNSKGPVGTNSGHLQKAGSSMLNRSRDDQDDREKRR